MRTHRHLRRNLVAAAAIAVGTLAAASPASAASCYPDASRLQVIVGRVVSTGLHCTDGANAPITPTGVAQASPARGLTITVSAGAGGAAELRVRAAADATPDSYNFPVFITLAGDERPDFRLVVVVTDEPSPRCSAKTSLEVRSDLGPALVPAGCTAPGDVGTLEVVAPPRHGTVRVADGGRGFRYTPSAGFTGTDSFTFRATNTYGSSPPVTIRLLVRKATVFELSAAYAAQVCAKAPAGTSCRAGNGRRTLGGPGTGKVSHRNWPAVTGVFLSALATEGSLYGGSLNDELLGHHGSDRLFGAAGNDILWGDQDPNNNTGRQSDVLVGGPGRDFIYTSHGRNSVRGGTGNDFIWAFYGRGTIDCGPGTDKVRLSGRAGAYKLKSCERRGAF